MLVNKLWHTTDEIPEDGAHILIQIKDLKHKNLNTYYVSFICFADMFLTFKRLNVQKWCYLTDLEKIT